MIPTYFIEDLTIPEVDKLIEKGVVFNVTSKASVLPKSNRVPNRDAFWGTRDYDSGDLRKTDSIKDNRSRRFT